MNIFQRKAQQDVREVKGSPAPTSFPNAQARKDYEAVRTAELAAQQNKKR